MKKQIETETRFKFNGELTKRKMREYMPAMLFTNLSTFLLLNVDGIVVGNMVGKNALASVNVFYPATVFIGVISALLSSGASIRLAKGMGEIDVKGLLKTRSTIKLLMVFAAVFVALVQIPVVALIISSYHLSPEMHSLTWSYAIGVMISMPFGLISTIGVLQLQIVGKMKILMGLAAMEGVANLLLDLLFVGPLGMGVAGAGYGTAGANILRATVTVIIIAKKTDMYYSGEEKADFGEVKAILASGLPESTHSLMMAVQNYIMMSIILSAFGETGGAIKGICSFAYSLTWILAASVQGTMRPIVGLYSGAKAIRGLRILMRQGVTLAAVLVLAMTAVIELFPEVIFFIHGVKDIPESGLVCLRLYASYLVFNGIDSQFRLFFANRGAVRFSTVLTIAGNATLPLFAFLLSRAFPAPYIWLAYLLTELIIIIANIIKYSVMRRKDEEMLSKNETDIYLSVVPKDAMEASRYIRSYAAKHEIDRKFAFRTALCMEELAAYAEKTRKREAVNLQVMIRFFEDSAMMMIIDDGDCRFLDRERETQKIVTSNYGVLKKIALTVEYQYILNLNYTVCRY